MGNSTLGIISDTHGLVRPEALQALEGVDLILHAGDVGNLEVLAPFQRIAPVHAVRGNMDHGPWADTLPVTEVVEQAGRSYFIIHNLEELKLDPAAAGFDAVIYGHTHRPANDRRDGVLYINPGSIGPRRFSLPVSMALLHIEPTGLRVEFIELDGVQES